MSSNQLYVLVKHKNGEVLYYDTAVGTFYPKQPGMGRNFQATLFVIKEEAEALQQCLSKNNMPCTVMTMADAGL